MKKDLIVLHGALGNAEQMQFLKPQLEQTFQLHFLDWEGHKKEEQLPEVFSITSFTKQLKEFVETNHLEQAGIFAYSMVDMWH